MMIPLRPWFWMIALMVLLPIECLAAAPLPQWLGERELAERGVHVADILVLDATRLIAGLSDGQMAGLELMPDGALAERWRIEAGGGRRLTALAAHDGVITATRYNDGVTFWTGDGATTPALSGTIAWPPGVALDVAMSGGAAYIAAGFDGIRIENTNLAGPAFPDVQTPGFVERVRLFGDMLIIGEGRDGLTMLRVEAPGQLTALGSLIVSGRIEDFALMGDYLAIAMGSDGLLLYNVSNPAAPVALDWRNDWSCVRVEAFDNGFVAGGWTLAAWGISPEGKLTPRAQVLADGSAASLGVMGGRALAGNFEGAVNVFKLAGRETPHPVFRFDTGRFIEQMAFNAQWVAGTGPRSRIWFFEWSENLQTAALLNEEFGHSFTQIEVHEDSVWSTDADRALEQWRFSAAANEFERTWMDTGRAGNAADFAREGDRLYTAARNYGWRIYDVGGGGEPTLEAEASAPMVLDQIAMSGGLLFGRTQFQGVRAFTLENPLAPQPQGLIYPWLPFHISARGDYVFVSRRRYGLEIWNFANPAVPELSGATPLFDARMTLPVSDTYVIVAEGVMGAAVVDWSDPHAPRLVCRLSPGDGVPVQWLHRFGNRIAAASGREMVFWPTGEIFQSEEFEGDLWMMR